MIENKPFVILRNISLEELVYKWCFRIMGGVGGGFGEISIHNDVGLVILMVQVITLHRNKYAENIILGISLMEFWNNGGCMLDGIYKG